MAGKVKPIPDGYHTVTPYFTVRDAAGAVEFYKQAFGAIEVMRMADPKGKIRHAEIRIGDSPIMIGDEFQEFPEMRSFQALGGSPVSVYLYVEDVDAMFNRAVAAGAKVRSPIRDEFYGDRVGAVEDPYGLGWFIATHKEEVAPEEIVRRASAMRD